MIALERWKSISIILIILILSYFTLVFGELVPKRVAMRYSEKLAFMAVGIIIETDKVIYKVEKIEGNRIKKVKACKV